MFTEELGVRQEVDLFNQSELRHAGVGGASGSGIKVYFAPSGITTSITLPMSLLVSSGVSTSKVEQIISPDLGPSHCNTVL